MFAERRSGLWLCMIVENVIVDNINAERRLELASLSVGL